MDNLANKRNNDYFFSTSVSNQTKQDEFIIEFYPRENNPKETAFKITKNFDELIEFIEQLEE